MTKEEMNEKIEFAVHNSCTAGECLRALLALDDNIQDYLPAPGKRASSHERAIAAYLVNCEEVEFDDVEFQLEAWCKRDDDGEPYFSSWYVPGTCDTGDAGAQEWCQFMANLVTIDIEDCENFWDR